MISRHIIETVRVKYGLDLSMFSASFLEKTVAQRMIETNSANAEFYLDILVKDADELVKLSSSLYIAYTLFFRNAIDVSHLEGFLLPDLVQQKSKGKSPSVRIWSAGCSNGAEAYSLAMMADRVVRDRNFNIPVMVFGTDISPESIVIAKKGKYDTAALQNVKFSYVEQYFSQKKGQFTIIDDVRNLVDFSQCDLADPGYTSPPAAIFADFDLVSCCNMMIYYNQEVQQMILEKLWRSLGRNGYLVVGESEQMIVEKSGRFRLLYPTGNIFVKN